jgi:hypothetical protein
MNFSDWTNMPPEPQQGVIDLPVVRGQYDNSGFDYARQRVELASLFAFSAGERGALSVVTAGTMATTRHYCRTE